MGKIILTDDQAIETIINWIKDSDMEDLATTLGYVFGGVCNVVPENENDFGSSYIYEFIPDHRYCGAFDHIKENNK